ncbi:hypothetical protein TEA_001434 [Camellia sinensis var. sinensis]|uniref:CBS domain-containing protein n=1 Tax=Camellia sinensis var. sinensis TaxID=542762 RepID=A0A4S4EXQ1_CAMSN|nr:hypothetical protein TEA_001434 [Camellia sinensis var. sinensis]
MDSIGFVCPRLPGATSALHHHQLPCILTCQSLIPRPPSSHRRLSISAIASATANSTPLRSGTCTVCDFMTKMEDLHVVKTTTTIDEALSSTALETLVDERITAFPVIDDDSKLIANLVLRSASWLTIVPIMSLISPPTVRNVKEFYCQEMVGVVSDYDLLALDAISGCGEAGANIFPDVHSSWKRFNEIQRLLSKTNGKVVGDMMTPDPLVVRETANLEDAVRLLIETKYHRLPVIDDDGRLVGIITRGNVVTAALQIRRASKRMP